MKLQHMALKLNLASGKTLCRAGNMHIYIHVYIYIYYLFSQSLSSTLKCPSIRLALKLVPCDHLDDRDAAHAAATTLAEALKGDGGGELNSSDLRHLP